VASQEEPPDVMSIIDALYEPDWHVAAVAAEHIRLLHQSQKLTDSQEALAIEALLEALGSKGHWWRFGWDREEAQFERFRGSAIAAVAGFGTESVDDVLAASYDGNSSQREAVCWIVLEMVKDETANIENLEQILKRLEDLAEADRDLAVRDICSYVQLEVRAEQ
jgi:HEAT repeat protein